MTPLTLHSRYARGQIILLALVIAAIFMVVGSALVGYATSYSRSERTTTAGAQALALAEGALENAVAKLNQDISYAGESNTSFGEGMFTITVSTIDSMTKQVVATGYVPSSQHPVAVRTVRANIGVNDTRISFHYAIQAGNGGFSLANSSSITGNVYSNGPIVGSGNFIYGSLVSAGPSGQVYGIHATGTAYSHTIGIAGTATTIDKDAYYVTKVNTTVGGTSYPNSPDQPGIDLPISDNQISNWETQAAAGGTITSCDKNGDYVISTSQSLGPKKIACNLVVKTSQGILTITGHLWVTGNITTQTGPTIKIDPALGNQNVAIIADNPIDQTGSGLITVGQTTIFQGSGVAGSFVFLISQNRSAEQGGATTAITLQQGSSALVAYAAHGLVSLSQSVSVKESTGYKIALSQSANVIYDNGLPTVIFDSGPGGSWSYSKGTYAILR